MNIEDSTYFDSTFGVGYVQISEQPVARTVEYSDAVVVDLDANDRVVGIEVLRWVAELPVLAMGDHFKWGTSTVNKVAVAASRLRSLMNATSTVSSDGVVDQTNGWSTPGLLPA
ncbi:DUF2283 domain-containing protein [Nesterenkonia sp. HG001]|uniref:DUF2283 domain-containing protein n=1 Tax=Nesterenkonia sp. HG001 TaxID=2983207 RepID=UPI002AC7D9EC|nr:DUF2283 domain-containing protein [Nesterenkonia sp. HG001]MDZ5076717.1 DUF2283 domain-containing protein [Nesterenkonia sp. HG001]